MEQDKEIKALQAAVEVLSNLDDDARNRVIQFLISKFSYTKPVKSIIGVDSGGGSSVDHISQFSQFQSVADLISKASPQKEADKVLLVAAYLQETKNKQELVSREISQELHNLGHAVSNITVVIGSLIAKKPQLMIQTRKEGKSRQAQKKYKVTTSGISRAFSLINEGKEL